MDYLDFELEIEAGSASMYPITVIRSPAGEAHATLHLPFDDQGLENQLSILQHALGSSTETSPQGLVSAEQTIQRFGQALLEALFTGQVRDLYVASWTEAESQGKGLRVKLRLQPPELAALPWEFLYDANQRQYLCLSNKTPVVRYVELPAPCQALSVTPPLSILGMTASPKDVAELDVAREQQRIDAALAGLQAKGLAKVSWLPGHTWEDLQQALLDGPWHIFHFIGHGGFDPNMNEGVIVLEDTAGQACSLSATQMGLLLADHHPLRLVVLNACEGARSSMHTLLASTAATLVRRGIPAVLAMQYAISDGAALALARVFYAALAAGLPVDTAVGEARKAIRLGGAQSLEWGTPVLHMHTPDGVLFELPSSAAPPARTRETDRTPAGSTPGRTPVITGAQEPPLSVFISYAHEDELLRQQLEAHLSLLRRQGSIADWHDRQILAGEEWARDIDEHLEAASLILLLISPDFLASDYCYGIEMRRALERHQNGEVQVMPILVRPVDWEGAPFAHLQCLPRDARAVTEWDNRDAAFRDIARGIRTAIEQLPSTSTQPQPMPAASGVPATASTRAPAVPTDRNRQRMLKRVHATWIAGVLEQSLHGAALMVLGLEEKADVLDNPWRLLLQEVDRPTQSLPRGTRITEVYNATEGGLLILGEPGAGKTTLLLELARDLLDRAQTSENAPIPVVFNLSSWAKKRLALSNWLVEELSIRYEVPRRLGQSWVSEDRLLLLLDGLDEVAPAARKDCIEAINSYRQTHPDVQVVVCSRSTEYLNEPTQLRLHSAVVVQPLTQEQIDTYLESAGEQTEALRETLRQDADLRELATTPLMLTILLFAYRGTSPDKISELTSLGAKREQIFASYVQHMLKRRGASKRYQPEQITHWLTYLARQMKRQNQTVFYIEQMQPDWMPKKWRRDLDRVLAGGVCGGLLGGLIGAAVGAISWSPGSFLYASPLLMAAIGSVIGLLIGLLIGLNLGLFYLKSTEIRTAEVITWSWANARLAAIASIVGGSLGWPIAYHSTPFILDFAQSLTSSLTYTSYSPLGGVIALLIVLLIPISLGGICFILISLFARRNLDGHRLTVSRQRIWSAARRGVLVGVVMGCIGFALVILTDSILSRLGVRWETGIPLDIYLVAVGCVSGLITGLIFGVSTGQLETHKSFKPNQGIWRSLYNGGRIWLVVGLIVWLAYELFVAVIDRPADSIDFHSEKFLTGVIVSISIGLFFGLLYGGIACIKHVLLRIFLWRARAMPWNYARFLDYAAERILLRKVGGGYIFVHRLLLEYFASLAIPFPEEASVVSAISNPPPAPSSTPQIDIAHREEKASAPVPSRKAGFNKENRIATLFVVVLLLLDLAIGSGIFSAVQHSVQKANEARATAQGQATATATAWVQANATATAQVQATATAQVQANTTAEARANASPVAYPPKNTSPVLNDSLQDNSQGNNWEVDDPSKGNCKFIHRAYDINTNQLEWCPAKATDFTNFIYEVQMKIVKGDGGGIAFRIDPTINYRYYYFAINQDGSYSVHAYTDTFTNYVLLAQGFSLAIHLGLNQTNLVATVVHGNIIELYVNHQRVAVVGSSTYTHGRIGVIVTGSSNQTEVIFQNAKVWKL